MVNNDLAKITSDIQTAGVDVVLELPCDRIAPLLFQFSEKIPYIPLTREEEGVGIAAGISLTGARPLMVVQSSGIGNMINAIMSLTKFYKLPLPIFISQRGVYKENIPAQVPMGSKLPKILDAIDVEYNSYNESSELSNITDELKETYKENKIKCFLISPKVCEGIPKSPLKRTLPIGNLKRGEKSKVSTENIITEMTGDLKTRYELLDELKDYLKGKAVICNMGYPSRELYTLLDQRSNFYMMGSLGLVSSIGLGVSLFSNSEVVVIDGDGSLLMNPNALIMIGALQPQNLTVICIDNSAYGSTGNQPTLTAEGLKLEELASASRIPNIMVTTNSENVLKFGGFGPKFMKMAAKPGNAKVGTIEISAIDMKNRFIDWLKK